MTELSEALRPYQPLMQLASVVLQGSILWRLIVSVKHLRLDEARARKEGIDPEAAESRRTSDR